MGVHRLCLAADLCAASLAWTVASPGKKVDGSRWGQRGMVLISVMGLVLILSVLASSAGRQMHWLLQTATQSSNQGRELAHRRVLIGALYGFDVGFLAADTVSGVCHRVAADVRVRFYPQPSSDLVWRFVLEQHQDDGSRNLLFEGWLRRRATAPHSVAALWFGSPPSR